MPIVSTPARVPMEETVMLWMARVTARLAGLALLAARNACKVQSHPYSVSPCFFACVLAIYASLAAFDLVSEVQALYNYQHASSTAVSSEFLSFVRFFLNSCCFGTSSGVFQHLLPHQ